MAVPSPDLAALQVLGDRVRPLAMAGERTLPAPPALASLLPQGGLQRGSLAATRGPAATSLALALSGPVTAGGAWVAVVGLPYLGLVAAAEMGVDLERVVLVDEPGPRRWASVVEALVDAIELVLVRPPAPVAPGIQRRLSARARDRGSVLLHVGGSAGAWAEAPDVVVASGASHWSGLGVGHGHLVARRIPVTVTGRRAAHRSRHADLWLPAPDGAIAIAEAATAVGPDQWTQPEVDGSEGLDQGFNRHRSGHGGRHRSVDDGVEHGAGPGVDGGAARPAQPGERVEVGGSEGFDQGQVSRRGAVRTARSADRSADRSDFDVLSEAG